MTVSASASNSNGSVRQSRQQVGLTQQQLAERIGCSVSYIRLLEGGYCPEHSDVMARLTQALEEPA